MNVTTAQFNTLRTRPHQTNLYLSIYKPKTIMVSRVTGTYSTGDIQINYYSVITGSYLNLYADQTVLVGSAPGADDYGRIRMRNATGTYVTFAENAITFQTNQYLTFIDQVDVQAIYPRIIQDPNNATNVIFYKDYDIPYSNQNTIFGTFPNAGPHRAGFMGEGNSFYFSATGSYNVNGDSLTYAWTFDSGLPATSTALTPGNVVWNTPGHYKVKLKITSSSGAVDETYRYVSWYRRPSEGTQVPIMRWELRNLSGSRSEGGYTASFKVWENLSDIQPNAVVVVFADTYYGGTKTNIGGNAVNNSSIVFVGYIIGDSIRFNWQDSSAEFSVGSITEIMKDAEGFSVSCESKASPTTWFELQEMDVAKAMYHYLRWHSTILRVADFQYTGDIRLVQYFDSDRGSLYDAIDSFVRDGLLGGVTADRQGKLWAEINPYGLTAPLTSIPNYVPPLDKQDWMETPSITERRNSNQSFIELGGIAYYGVSSNTFSALLSNAPSTVPLYHGKSDRKEGLILSSQNQLNKIAGNYLAYYNSKYPEVVMSLNGTYLNFDIAPLERLRLNVASEDTVMGTNLQGYSYVLESMDWKYSSTQESFVPDVVLNQIATGTSGVTVEIPPIPPDNGYSYPKLSLPPLPVFGGSPSVGPTVPMRVIFWERTAGIVVTDNFDSGSPNYYTANVGLSTRQLQNLNFMFVCPNGSFYVGRCDSFANSQRGTNDVRSPFIARAAYVGAPFVIVEDEDSLWAKYPEHPTENHAIKACTFNPLVPESVAYIMGQDTGAAGVSDYNVWLGSSATFAEKAAVTNIDTNHSMNGFTFGNNTWVYTGANTNFLNPASAWVFNVGATAIQSNPQFGDISEWAHIRGGTTSYLYTIGLSSGDVRKSTDNGLTWSLAGNTNLNGGAGMSVDTITGLWLMLRLSPANKGKSSDGLSAVVSLPNLPPLTSYVYGYAGGTSVSSSRWIAANSVIRYSPDFGNTWVEKGGDMSAIQAIYNIRMVYVPGVSQHQAILPDIF